MKTFVLQLALLTTSAVIIAVAWTSMSVTQAPLTKVDLDHGAVLFQQRCATCHSLGGDSASGIGPGLKRIGEVAESRSPDRSAEAYLLQSIIDPAAFRAPGEQRVMPKDISSGLSPTDLLSLVGYLKEQGGENDWNRLLALKPQAQAPLSLDVEPKVDLAKVEAGRRIFLDQGKVHQLPRIAGDAWSRSGRATLLHAGRHELTYLRESILSPSKVNPHTYRSWLVRLDDGRVISGRLLRSTDATFELLVVGEGSKGARLVEVQRDEIMLDDDDQPLLKESSASMMPEDLATNFSPLEVEQLLAFLRTLK